MKETTRLRQVEGQSNLKLQKRQKKAKQATKETQMLKKETQQEAIQNVKMRMEKGGDEADDEEESGKPGDTPTNCRPPTEAVDK